LRQAVGLATFQHHFFSNIFTDNAQFTNTVQQHTGYVVVAHQQQVNRKILSIPVQLVLAACEP